MNISADGTMMFEDIYELTYELLTTMEYEIRPDGVIYEPERNAILSLNGNIIKATIRPDDIHYAGQNEIEFDIMRNIRLITMLFGQCLQKKQKEGMPFVSYYQEEKEIDSIKYTNLVVKQTTTDFVSTKYYHNKCLKFIEIIFLLDEQPVDLSNFDILEE